MARLFLSSDRVRRLVDQLVPLFAEAGSINNLCALLNQAVGADGDWELVHKVPPSGNSSRSPLRTRHSSTRVLLNVCSTA